MLDVKPRAGMLALLTLLIVSGITASTSSASGPYWKVNGVKLAGQQEKAHQIKLQVKGSRSTFRPNRWRLGIGSPVQW